MSRRLIPNRVFQQDEERVVQAQAVDGPYHHGGERRVQIREHRFLGCAAGKHFLTGRCDGGSHPVVSGHKPVGISGKLLRFFAV
jgi:hypothetical protein